MVLLHLTWTTDLNHFFPLVKVNNSPSSCLAPAAGQCCRGCTCLCFKRHQAFAQETTVDTSEGGDFGCTGVILPKYDNRKKVNCGNSVFWPLLCYLKLPSFKGISLTNRAALRMTTKPQQKSAISITLPRAIFSPELRYRWYSVSKNTGFCIKWSNTQNQCPLDFVLACVLEHFDTIISPFLNKRKRIPWDIWDSKTPKFPD